MTSKELAVHTPWRQSTEDHLDPTTPTAKARRAGLETCCCSLPRRRDLRHGGYSLDPTRLLHHHQRSSMPGTPHHEGCSAAVLEERCHQTSNMVTPAAAWPHATSEDTTDLQEATHYDLFGTDLPTDSVGTPSTPRWPLEPYGRGATHPAPLRSRPR
jgi:hypothetical protein